MCAGCIAPVGAWSIKPAHMKPSVVFPKHGRSIGSLVPMKREAFKVLLAVRLHSNPRAAPMISDPQAAHATTHGRPLNNLRVDRPSSVGLWVPSLRVKP